MTAGRRASKSNAVYASSNARHDGGSDNSTTCKRIRGSRQRLPLLPRQRQHHVRKPDAPRHSISGGGRRFLIAGFSKLAAQNNEPHPCPLSIWRNRLPSAILLLRGTRKSLAQKEHI